MPRTEECGDDYCMYLLFLENDFGCDIYRLFSLDYIEKGSVGYCSLYNANYR